MRTLSFLVMTLEVEGAVMALAAPQNPNIVTAEGLSLPVNHSNSQPIRTTPLVNGSISDPIHGT